MKTPTLPQRLLSGLVLLLLTITMTATGESRERAEEKPIQLNTTKYRKLFADLQTRGFSRSRLDQIFSGLTINPKVLKLFEKQWSKPTPWYQYRPRFLTRPVIIRGKNYLRKFRPLFDRIEKQYGVNREVIVAIWAVETHFGGNTGNFEMLRSLNTLFAASPRRSDFFRNELIEYLLLCKKNGFDPRALKGSWAGALGQAQFMPSSYNRYAVDFDGDNRADLFTSRPDIFASVANYLRHFGWRLDQPVYRRLGHRLNSRQLEKIASGGWDNTVSWTVLKKQQGITLPKPAAGSALTLVPLDLDPKNGGGKLFLVGYPNFQAIQHYNHSQKYATVVSQLAEALAE